MSKTASYAVTSDQQAKQILASQHGVETVRPCVVKSGEGVLEAGTVIALKTADGKAYGVRLATLASDVQSTDTEVTLTDTPLFKAGDVVDIGSITGQTITEVDTANKKLTFGAQLGATASAGDKVTLSTPDGRENPVGILLEEVDASSADAAGTYLLHGIFRSAALVGYNSAHVKAHDGLDMVSAVSINV